MKDKAEEALLGRMMEDGYMGKGEAIATAKNRGWMKQDGKSVKLTAKGKQHARKAMQKKK